MSFNNNRTRELWKSFMPVRHELVNKVSNDVISMQLYKPSYFVSFDPVMEFEKWATVEVNDFDNIPADLETFTLSNGCYAVFDYKGLSNDVRIFQYIFQNWLPASDYLLDDRAHFEVLGEKYRNNDPDSEEEIWIPIKQRPSNR